MRGAWVLGFLGVATVAACGGRSITEEGGGGGVVIEPNAAGAPGVAGAPNAGGAPPVTGIPSAGAPATTTPGGGVVLPGSVARGRAVFRDQINGACNSCHGENGEGMLGPNITGSPSAGIGGWTFKQFYTAVRFGRGIDNSMLCPFMIPFEPKYVSDDDLVDVFAFLQSKRSDIPVQGTYCPR